MWGSGVSSALDLSRPTLLCTAHLTLSSQPPLHPSRSAALPFHATARLPSRRSSLASPPPSPSPSHSCLHPPQPISTPPGGLPSSHPLFHDDQSRLYSLRAAPRRLTHVFTPLNRSPPLQVAFQALIPCFMMTKVASTLSVQPLSSLAFLPLLVVFQLLPRPPASSHSVVGGTNPGSSVDKSSSSRQASLLSFAYHRTTSLTSALLVNPFHPSPLSGPLWSRILCGIVLGKLACTIAYRRPSSLSSLPSPPSARHIAFSVAQSLGLSPSAAALLSGLPPPTRNGGEEGAAGGEKVVPGRGVLSAPGMVGAAERAAGRKESVVMAACAFGNSLTLPLVFLATLLTRADADRAAGYLALFMVGHMLPPSHPPLCPLFLPHPSPRPLVQQIDCLLDPGIQHVQRPSPMLPLLPSFPIALNTTPYPPQPLAADRLPSGP
ncbi:unnamed protein product [Closterium sp. Naga37s-1]|nr:unnamed protein product [Closterium sp. Naga37s-1]